VTLKTHCRLSKRIRGATHARTARIEVDHTLSPYPTSYSCTSGTAPSQTASHTSRCRSRLPVGARLQSPICQYIGTLKEEAREGK
jgi:hypothetical protein